MTNSKKRSDRSPASRMRRRCGGAEVMRDWADAMVAQARAERLLLMGMLDMSTPTIRQVLQPVLEVEISDHLRFARRNPAGCGAASVSAKHMAVGSVRFGLVVGAPSARVVPGQTMRDEPTRVKGTVILESGDRRGLVTEPSVT